MEAASHDQRKLRIANTHPEIAEILNRFPFSSASFHLAKLIEDYLILRLKHLKIVNRLRREHVAPRHHLLNDITHRRQVADALFQRTNLTNSRTKLIELLDRYQSMIRDVASMRVLNVLNDLDVYLPFELHEFEYWM